MLKVRCSNWFVARPPASVALSLAIGLSACAISHPDYPSGWVPLEKSSARSCPNLAGLFENTSTERPVATLSFVLLRHRPEPPKDRGFSSFKSSPLDVRIVQPTQDTLDVHVYQFRGSVEPVASASFSREKGDFECDSEWMTFKSRSSTDAGTSEIQFVGIGVEFVALARSKDGSIVAKWSGAGTGLALGIIPFGGTTTEWHRFKPVPPPPVRRENEPVYWP